MSLEHLRVINCVRRVVQACVDTTDTVFMCNELNGLMAEGFCVLHCKEILDILNTVVRPAFDKNWIGNGLYADFYTHPFSMTVNQNNEVNALRLQILDALEEDFKDVP